MTNEVRLHDLEQQAQQLSREEQLWLIERLVHHLRSTSPVGPAPSDVVLASMAADPEIQRELRAIEREFAGTDEVRPAEG